QLKWELEDLSLRAIEPVEYQKIARHLDERRLDRQRFIDNVIATLRKDLEDAGVTAEVTGRPKHIYSIWNKMRRKPGGIEAIYDIRAVRILVDSIKDCYTALGIVHQLWTPVPNEFDDYIAKPKPNNYRSLHPAVIGARVDGHMVPLNYVLRNGQQVEVITAKQGGPSRDWLNPDLGYVHSHRARTKVRQWFKAQQLDETIAQGRTMVERELARLGRSS